MCSSAFAIEDLHLLVRQTVSSMSSSSTTCVPPLEPVNRSSRAERDLPTAYGTLRKILKARRALRRTCTCPE